jgi:D-beta-D-heptose 7-phosphate kinase / D-beta-D-heptose 1-phosphate adenosyltransferase
VEELLERCLHKRPTVLVVGDVMCDTYVSGRIARISPEAPVPIFESTEQHQTLGGAGNVASNLQALGCDVRLLSIVGNDAGAYRVRELLRNQGIADTWLLEDSTRPTTEKTRLLAQQQQVLRLDQESRTPLARSQIACALTHAHSLMAEVDGVVCSDYGKGMCTADLLEPLFAMARASGHPIVVDPKKRDFSGYRGATVLTPNLTEAEQASGMSLDDPAGMEQAVATLLSQSEAQALLLTRGKDGMSLFCPSQPPLHIPARAREVYDVTGAGDTVIATFSMGILCSLSLAEAARLANVAAGIVVGKIGTSVVSLEELREALSERYSPYKKKILLRDELSVALQYHRQRGERIVFTNGCFDLLHMGHLHYLEEAARLGDRLVVGVNDDASVSFLKGEGRPVISQENRIRMLAGLACVDYVTVFSESTPLALLNAVRPDILVKGGNYTPETTVGRDEVEANGGTVKIVPYMPSVSTTNIIESIVKRYG